MVTGTVVFSQYREMVTSVLFGNSDKHPVSGTEMQPASQPDQTIRLSSRQADIALDRSVLDSFVPRAQRTTVDVPLETADLSTLERHPLGIYIHVPFCTSRCGYCDFNTYTAGQLGDVSSPSVWFTALQKELFAGVEKLAQLGVNPPAAKTVFVGGGTPSLLGGELLAQVLDLVRDSFGLADDAEVTTEANPESTDPRFFEQLREAGFNRISLGMQSVAEHVLRVLERRHSPGRALSAIGEARQAGFDHLNLDMIYGTPGETDSDLRATLDTVLSAGVDHVSAYALIVEEGTALARKINRGQIPGVDDDVLADRYRIIDTSLSSNGFSWYEVSNWALDSAPRDWGLNDARCRHNLGYWENGNWWGAGPGAHSHIGNLRWANHKHPGTYAAAAESGRLPASFVETLSGDDRHTESVMLQLRLASGLPLTELGDAERLAARSFEDDGLLRQLDECLILTDAGRLLADRVVRDILCA